MKKNKGCINSECVAHQKHIFFREDDYYCPKCGNGLVFVCCECYRPFEVQDNSKKYCVSCEQERENKKQEKLDTLKKVGPGVVAGVAAVGAAAKKYGPVIVKKAVSIVKH